MSRLRVLLVFFCFSLLSLSFLYSSNIFFFSNYTAKNHQNPKSMDNSSMMSVQDQNVTMTLNNTIIFQNLFINLNYIVNGDSNLSIFKSSADSTMSEIVQSSIIQYTFNFSNPDIQILLTFSIYLNQNAVIFNGTIIPQKDFLFYSNFDMITCALSDLMPQFDQSSLFLSCFSGNSIWGSYQNQDLESMVDGILTPVLINNGTNGFLIGALTSNIFETEISTSNNQFQLYMPIINGYQATINNSIPIETVWMQYGLNFTQLFLNYAEQVKMFNPPVRPQTVTNFYGDDAGMCDWYSDYGGLNDATVNAEINEVATLVPNGLGYFIMDDGWGSNDIGKYYNWSTWDPVKFPNGLTSIINKAHQDGLKFVIWNRIGYAPIWVQENHPDWVISWGSGDVKTPTMNLVLPTVQNYMAAVFANWSAQGIDGIKVDFIMSEIDQSAWNTTLWNSQFTRTQQVNLYLNMLDEYASNYNISVILCDTPYGYPSVAKYTNLVASRITRDSTSQGLYTSQQIKDALLRAFWWAVAFNSPDPDAYDSRDWNSILTAAACGGAIYFGNSKQTLDISQANLCWKLRWDTPAQPENQAFFQNEMLLNGYCQGTQAILIINLSVNTTFTYSVPVLMNHYSLINVSADQTFIDQRGSFTATIIPNSMQMFLICDGDDPILLLWNQQSNNLNNQLNFLKVVVAVLIPLVIIIGIFLMKEIKFRQKYRTKN